MKKIFLTVGVLALLLCIVMSIHAFAQPSVSVSGNMITVSDQISMANVGKSVTMHLTKSDGNIILNIDNALKAGNLEIDGLTLENYLNNNVLYAYQLETNQNGSYEHCIFMDVMTDESIYNITIGGDGYDGGVFQIPIRYKGTKKFIEAVDLLNAAANITDIDSILKAYSEYFEFDLTQYNKNALNKQFICEQFLNKNYSREIVDFSKTVTQIKKDYEIATMLAVLNNESNSAAIIAYIQSNRVVLGLDENIFSTLSVGVLNELGNRISQMSFSGISEFTDMFPKLKLICMINNSESWGYLASLTEENAELFNVRYSMLSQYSQKRMGVYKELNTIVQNKGFDSIEEYSVAFKNVFENYVIPTNNQSVGGGGTHSSSSSVSVPTAGVEVINNPPITAKDEIEQTQSFSDISGHWAEKVIETLVEKSLMYGKGNNLFAPDEAITRAEFAAVLSRVIKAVEKDKKSQFSDVDKDVDWFAGAVYALEDMGIISGYDGQFKPNNKISREEMAKMIVLAYEYVKSESVATNDVALVDMDTVSDWAKVYVGKCVGLGFISGSPKKEGNVILPQQSATRAEVAKVILSLNNSLNK